MMWLPRSWLENAAMSRMLYSLHQLTLGLVSWAIILDDPTTPFIHISAILSPLKFLPLV